MNIPLILLCLAVIIAAHYGHKRRRKIDEPCSAWRGIREKAGVTEYDEILRSEKIARGE